MEKTENRFIDIIGIEKFRYEINKKGEVYDSFSRRLLIASYDAKTGFAKVSLRTLGGRQKGFLVHRLVFEVYKPVEFKNGVKEKKQIIHKNGNVRDNHVDNLEMGTIAEARKQRKGEISKIIK